MEYWIDGDWYVGGLPQVPSVFSQGRTLSELKRNLLEAFQLMQAESS
jgi:predicted RNase H-like HicB family nuclease